MSKVKSRRSKTIDVRGRTFEVERISWRGTSGLSFDVTDVATGQCLTAESFDDEPTAEEIEELLDQLRDDLDSDSLDFFFKGEEDTVRKIVGFAPQWTCPGCNTQIKESDADIIVDHVQDCDRVDGTGARR
jgi:hypothetical protein